MRFLTILLLIAITPLTAYAKEQDKFLDIKEVRSNSGITAWLVEDHSLPIISLQFAFKGAGAINDTAENQGRAKLLSNTLDEGAGDLSSQEFQKELSDNSINLSFSSSRDNFSGQLKTLTRYKEKAFSLLNVAITKPRFDEEPLQRMKQANISRIKSSITDPNWIAARLQNDLIYSNHPYSLNSGGTISTLNNLTPQDLREFKNSYLTKDNLVIGVVGDITVDELKIQLDKIFGSLPEKSKKNNINSTALHKNGVFLYKKDIPQTIIKLSYPAFDRNDPDYYAAQIFNYIFGGAGFGSRLMEEVREKEGLTYGIYSSLSFLNQSQKFYISTSTQNDKSNRVLEIINKETNKIKNEPITEKELNNAKNYIIGSLPLSLTSTSKISGLLVALQKNDRPINYLDNYKTNIEKVTINDVSRVAKRILNNNLLNIIMVGNPNINNSDNNNFTELKELPNVY